MLNFLMERVNLGRSGAALIGAQLGTPIPLPPPGLPSKPKSASAPNPQHSILNPTGLKSAHDRGHPSILNQLARHGTKSYIMKSKAPSPKPEANPKPWT